MLRSRALAVSATLAVVALLLSSCCCGGRFGRRSGVTIPTPGGPVTVTETKDGQSGTIKTPDGTMTYSQDGNQGKVTNEKGETMSWGTTLEKATADKLDIPIYPKAEVKGTIDVSGSINVTLETQDAFADVASWYQDQLGSSWEKAEMSAEDSKITTYKTADDKANVMIMTEKGEAVSIMLTRNVQKD